MMKKKIRLKNGNSLKAVLDFWNMKEKRYEYPINESAKRNRISTR